MSVTPVNETTACNCSNRRDVTLAPFLSEPELYRSDDHVELFDVVLCNLHPWKSEWAPAHITWPDHEPVYGHWDVASGKWLPFDNYFVTAESYDYTPGSDRENPANRFDSRVRWSFIVNKTTGGEHLKSILAQRPDVLDKPDTVTFYATLIDGWNPERPAVTISDYSVHEVMSRLEGHQQYFGDYCTMFHIWVDHTPVSRTPVARDGEPGEPQGRHEPGTPTSAVDQPMFRPEDLAARLELVVNNKAPGAVKKAKRPFRKIVKRSRRTVFRCLWPLK